MGFFGVLRPLFGDQHNEISTETFRVEQLDVNLWLLPDLLTGLTAYCDIGIRIAAIDTNVTCFDICVPFVPQEGVQDLSSILSHTETASLVFGEDVLHNALSDFHLRQRCRVEAVASQSSDMLTVIRLSPTAQLTPGQKAYFRIRMQIGEPGRLVIWRRRALRLRRDVLVDIRVSDLREAAFIPANLVPEERIVRIGRVNALVIAPASLKNIRSHPPLRYIRVLEGVNWERYMQRALDLTRRGKYIVYFWRPQGPIASGTEFRGFLELSRGKASAAHTWLAALVTIVAVLAGQAGGFWASPLGNLVSAGSEWVVALWQRYTAIAVGITGLAGLFAVVSLAASVTRRTPSALRRLREIGYRFREIVYRKRGNL